MDELFLGTFAAGGFGIGHGADAWNVRSLANILSTSSRIFSRLVGLSNVFNLKGLCL